MYPRVGHPVATNELRRRDGQTHNITRSDTTDVSYSLLLRQRGGVRRSFVLSVSRMTRERVKGRRPNMVGMGKGNPLYTVSQKTRQIWQAVVSTSMD